MGQSAEKMTPPSPPKKKRVNWKKWESDDKGENLSETGMISVPLRQHRAFRQAFTNNILFFDLGVNFYTLT